MNIGLSYAITGVYNRRCKVSILRWILHDHDDTSIQALTFHLGQLPALAYVPLGTHGKHMKPNQMKKAEKARARQVVKD